MTRPEADREALVDDLLRIVTAIVLVVVLGAVLSFVPLPNAVDAVLLVGACGVLGWRGGRVAGWAGAIAASSWFAVALTTPAFRPRIDDPADAVLTVVVILGGAVAGMSADVVRGTWRDGRRVVWDLSATERSLLAVFVPTVFALFAGFVVGLPTEVDALLTVAITLLVGWASGRADGLLTALLGTAWFALALTEPAFEPRIDTTREVALTAVVLVTSLPVAVVGDVVRTSRHAG